MTEAERNRVAKTFGAILDQLPDNLPTFTMMAMDRGAEAPIIQMDVIDKDRDLKFGYRWVIMPAFSDSAYTRAAVERGLAELQLWLLKGESTG